MLNLVKNGQNAIEGDHVKPGRSWTFVRRDRSYGYTTPCRVPTDPGFGTTGIHEHRRNPETCQPIETTTPKYSG